jgi:hypothetical protein
MIARDRRTADVVKMKERIRKTVFESFGSKISEKMSSSSRPKVELEKLASAGLRIIFLELK